MTSTEPKRWWRILLSPMFTPMGFVGRAACIALIYATCELMGGRPYTSILSGTAPTVDGSVRVGTAFGVFYGIAYFAFVVLVPILLIGAVVFWVLVRRHPISQAAESGVGPPNAQLHDPPIPTDDLADKYRMSTFGGVDHHGGTLAADSGSVGTSTA